MIIITLILGFIMLILGANLLVESSIKIAKRFNISTMVISMTIIAIGTSMPEFAIACISSFKGNQITLSNNIGSNISAIAISIGLTSILIGAIPIKRSISKEVIQMLIVQVFLMLLLYLGGSLDFKDGIIFIILFLVYMANLIKKAKNIVSIEDEEELIKEDSKLIDETVAVFKNSVITLSLFIIMGITFIFYGGNFVVDSATKIANNFGLSEAFIAVTVVAFGTTLPELSTAILAARKKEYDIIIGNVVGSGVSNILLIVGTASIIHPIKCTNILIFQIMFMLFFGFCMYKLARKGKIEKLDGVALLITYTVFVVSSLILAKST